MATKIATAEEQKIQERIDNLIAIGAATAANCIPCFEQLYEKAINSGITLTEIKRASDIAGQVKKGAHTSLTNSINEIIGTEGAQDSPCNKTDDKSCCC